MKSLPKKNVYVIWIVGVIILVSLIFFLIVIVAGLGYGKYLKYIKFNNAPIDKPLYFGGLSLKDTRSLTPEQQKSVSDYKKKILARVVSKVSLTPEEKSIIAVSLMTNQQESPLGILVVGQSIYQFTADELTIINEALKR